MPQWGTVGVNSTVTLSGFFGSNVICGADTTASCSRDMLLCSGSDIDLISSEDEERRSGAARSVTDIRRTEDLVLVYLLRFVRVIILRVALAFRVVEPKRVRLGELVLTRLCCYKHCRIRVEDLHASVS